MGTAAWSSSSRAERRISSPKSLLQQGLPQFCFADLRVPKNMTPRIEYSGLHRKILKILNLERKTEHCDCLHKIDLPEKTFEHVEVSSFHVRESVGLL